MYHESWAAQPCKPTIWYIENSMQKIEEYVSIEELEISDLECEAEQDRKKMHRLSRSLCCRLLLLPLLLFCAWTVYTRWYRPYMEQLALTKSMVDGLVGAQAAYTQPESEDMIMVQTLNQRLVPSSGTKAKHGRLVIVGDVHGMKNELEKLLEKVKFDRYMDHLILAGDMISKGPDSVGVLDYVMGLGAHSVRGNHEDRILLAYAKLHSHDVQRNLDPILQGPDKQDENLADAEMLSYKGELKDRLLAKQLSPEHIEWLKKCPIILNLGKIEDMGQVLVVHAGLVPGVSLEAQDPYFVMNMRTIDTKTHIPSDSREGTAWTKLWNHYQEQLEPHQRSTVIYGHDSKRGLAIDTYSRGLDSGCLKGGQLTALVIEVDPSGAKQTIVQLNCVDGRA